MTSFRKEIFGKVSSIEPVQENLTFHSLNKSKAHSHHNLYKRKGGGGNPNLVKKSKFDQENYPKKHKFPF